MYEYKGKVVKVVDGDTYDVLVDLGFAIFHKIRVRLKDVDTPEVFGRDATVEGRIASDFVKTLLLDKDVIIRTYKDRATTYGRWEADVQLLEPLVLDWEMFVESKGAIEFETDLGEILVALGYAERWSKE